MAPESSTTPISFTVEPSLAVEVRGKLLFASEEVIVTEVRTTP